MPLEFTATVMKVGNGLLITLPKAVCDGFKIEKGDQLKLRVKDDEIVIPMSEKNERTPDKEARRLR